MAIHVRRKGKLLAERRKRMIISSLLSALTVIVLGGLIMYFVVIFFAKEEPAEFITYTPPPSNDDIPKPPTEETSSSRAAAPSPDINPSVIVSTSVSTVVMARVDVDVPDFGVGNGLGEGDGMGFDGSGFGSGMGKGNGKGDGGGGKGLNDDVQVVLCLDASGSMDELFVEVSDSLNMLVNTMTRCRLNGKKARVNLGIVVYGQAMDNGAPRVLTPFTTDVKSMRAKLREIQCDGAVEPCGEVIDFALNNFEWNMRDREDILKIIFLAGNEEFSQGSLDYRTAMHKAKRKNIIVNTIYCGLPEEVAMSDPQAREWADAASLADGMGLFIAMDGTSPAGSPDDAKLLAAAKALWDIPVMAMGGPGAQARCMKEYAGRPAIPKKQNEVNDWLADNSDLLVRSYDWDLVELCRRYEDEFSLDLIGGPGNLPKELRGISPSEAVSRLQDAAETRNKALRNYMNAAGAGTGFCGKALRALRIQAQEKGIELKS